MNGLREKFRNKKGFTLVEMLIVVAIIAILIAVSIPVVAGALEKTRDAADQANERAAKGAAMVVYLSGLTGDDGNDVTFTGTKYAPGMAFTAKYDAVNGHLVKADATDVTAYGKCTKKGCYTTSGVTPGGESGNAGMVLSVTVTATGAVTLAWVSP